MSDAALVRVRTPPVPDLLARHNAQVPRYTSYPTAMAFSPEIHAGTWGTWLSRSEPQQAVSLYVHIPFCRRLCWYCGCNTRAVNRTTTMTTYVDLLLREAGLIGGVLGRRARVATLHYGGGTPNMLPPAELERLHAGLAAQFDLEGCHEIAAELDPEVLTPDWIAAAGRIGLNRASLGVQDLSPVVQAAINRPEAFETIERAVSLLRAVGVRSVNLDLMYGLPLQTVEGLVTTLGQVTRLLPDRIALFGYAHVPWMKPHQKLIREADLPDAEARHHQSVAAWRYLVSKGWQAVGLDHFALPHDALALAAREGRLRRNFQGYTTDTAPVLIGLGASSISRAPQGYVQNHSQERDWRAAVGAGHLPVARGVALSADERFVGALIERLMCDMTVDALGLARAHGHDPAGLAPAFARLEAFERDGLVVVSGGWVTLTEAGRPFVRGVCAAFDPAHVPSPDRHARMV